MTVEEIALVCHEVNRAYCKSLGDDSQCGWIIAGDEQRRSCINGVRFHIGNPDVGPEESHENWLKEKREHGWVYGEVKDEDKKTHPCCVPYSELPKEQQAKDFIFRQIVHSLS